jgi:phosphatidylglycerol:prolipoprotein diacylglycerol transferase
MELWGGLTGGGVALHRYSRQRELAFFHLADALAPAVAMGAFVGRVGCYLAGCCYGRPTTSRLGVPFGPLSLAYHQLVVHRPTATEAAPAATTAALHPTQLYLAGAMLTLFVCLSLLRSVKRAHGEVLLAFVVLYPAATLLPELLRGDRSPQRLLAVSTPALHRWLGLAPEPASVGTLSQLVALLALGGAVALYLRLRADRDR